MPGVMITGVHGCVGSRALAYYRDAIPVPGELLREPGEELDAFVKKHSPDVIINGAAISDIGTCEKNPEASYSANVVLPVVLAKAAQAVGAKLVSFSSDQVYTGCRSAGPYRETDILPEPANLYARHKLEAEARVLDVLPDAVMLRATWMYDMPVYGGEGAHSNRGNFLVNTMGAVLQGKPLVFSSGEYRGITYVRQVVRLLDPVCTLPGGVYNYGSENPLSMLDTAKALLDALGLDASVQDAEPKRHDLRMDCGRLRSRGICFDTTAEGFARCVQDYGLRW